MQTKLKTCSRCKKEKSIWKNKTIEGEKKQFCQTCWGIVDRETQKAKRKIQREKKASSTSKLIKVLDSVFSLYIRLRDTDKNGVGYCIDCGERVEWSNAQNGHCFSRMKMSVRFDEQNCNLQRDGCNMFQQGRQYEYTKGIDQKYGDGTAEQVYRRSLEIRKWTSIELKEMIAYYEEKNRELIKDKCFDFKTKSP